MHGRIRLVAQLRVPPHRAEQVDAVHLERTHANSGGAGMLPRRDSRHPSAAFTRSGVNGVWRSRTPASCAIAPPIAGATSGVAIWPAPVGGLSVGITST